MDIDGALQPASPAGEEIRRSGSTRCVVLLGATLALGAGCEADARFDPKLPALAIQPAELRMEEEVPEVDAPTELALHAEQGRAGDLEASPGFVPDPLTVEGRTAGGPLDAREHDDRCVGWVAAQPDYVLSADRPFAELAVMVASAEPTTLVVVGPDGQARCAHDERGLPLLRGPLARGRHRIWVGTHARGVEVPYVLALSELDDTHPRQLVH